MEFADQATAYATTSTVIDELRAGVAELGPGRAVELLDVQPSVLSEALSPLPDPRRGAREPKRRHFQLRWFARLLLAFPPSRRFSILNSLAELCGFELSYRKKLSAEQRAAELERALLDFGEPGRERLEKVPR